MRRASSASRGAALSVVALLALSCRDRPAGEEPAALPSVEPDLEGATEPEATQGLSSVAEAPPPDQPMLGITSYAAIVYAEPRDTAKRLGYLRVGAKIVRSEEPAATPKSCKQGFYRIHPRGYVCMGRDATLDLDAPVLRAAERRPELTAAMPYRYGFVRAVLPLYLRVPTADEQYKSEFKLKEHLAWYAEKKKEVDQVNLGAWDVPLDARGVPIPGRRLGELGRNKSSLEMGLGELFGGTTDEDPIPFWLEGGKRLIPNVSDFEVPEYAVFADRARRFTGLGFVGSFATGEESLHRRFAVTTDLRLAPATKVKPDTGSPFHGVELGTARGAEAPLELPIAFVRSRGASRYVASGKNDARASGDLQHRSVVRLSGKQKRFAGEPYYATRDGAYVRASDVGLVVAPRRFPKVADDGEKWIEIALGQQTITLWEGTRPVYATLVSSGRKEHPTITGEFRIQSKHVTATMDSDERSAGAPSPPRGRTADKSGQGAKPKRSANSDDQGAIPRKGDGEYGVTRRRGEGTYQLRDVPYIQYFSGGYALHAAYWHDVFGQERSHGCVNLSPIDAHRVFMWTEPAVAEGWHGINTGGEMGVGTTVIVHE